MVQPTRLTPSSNQFIQPGPPSPSRQDLRSKNSESAHRHPLADPGGPSQSPLAKLYRPSSACKGLGRLGQFRHVLPALVAKETALLQLWGCTTVTSPFRATSVIISGSDKINQLPNCGPRVRRHPHHPIRRPNFHSRQRKSTIPAHHNKLNGV